MKVPFIALEVRRVLRLALVLMIFAALALTSASPTLVQKDKKKKTDPNAAADSTNPLVPMSDQGQIDYMISEMLGAWQIGDIDKLHKDIADDITVVSGAYAPPIVGWNDYLAAYKAQRAKMQQVRLDRSNTLIKIDGTVAWACYQWDFQAVENGTPTGVQGQTTLVMEKRNAHWIVVHNHTSMVRQLAANEVGAPAANQPVVAQPQPK
jgi:ketosteroid isomerase-like protein